MFDTDPIGRRVALAAGVGAAATIACALARPDIVGRASERLGLYQPDRSETWRDTLALQLRIDAQASKNDSAQAGAGRVLFFGDSHIAGLDVASLVPNALNFGIGGDTVRSLAYRLRFYETVKTAKSIAIAVGLNELSTASAERAAGLFADLLNTLDVTRTVVCSVFPVDLSVPSVAAKFGRDMNDRISEFNERIAALAASKRALFVQSLPPGRFLPVIWHSGDGVHLNPTGYKLWATRLRDCPLLQA